MAVDAVEVKIVVDGFVDVLMADAPGAPRASLPPIDHEDRTRTHRSAPDCRGPG
jgi:hypothetical protein